MNDDCEETNFVQILFFRDLHNFCIRNLNRHTDDLMCNAINNDERNIFRRRTKWKKKFVQNSPALILQILFECNLPKQQKERKKRRRRKFICRQFLLIDFEHIQPIAVRYDCFKKFLWFARARGVGVCAAVEEDGDTLWYLMIYLLFFSKSNGIHIRPWFSAWFSILFSFSLGKLSIQPNAGLFWSRRITEKKYL